MVNRLNKLLSLLDDTLLVMYGILHVCNHFLVARPKFEERPLHVNFTEQFFNLAHVGREVFLRFNLNLGRRDIQQVSGLAATRFRAQEAVLGKPPILRRKVERRLIPRLQFRRA